MRDLLLVAICLPSVACFVGAAYVASRGKEGWGWLLFIGFILTPPPSVAVKAFDAAIPRIGHEGTGTLVVS